MGKGGDMVVNPTAKQAAGGPKDVKQASADPTAKQTGTGVEKQPPTAASTAAGSPQPAATKNETPAATLKKDPTPAATTSQVSSGGLQEVPRAKWQNVTPASTLGANLIDASQTCHFGVWAPQASKCFVEITSTPSGSLRAPQKYEMIKDALESGVFSTQLSNVPSGTSYHYVIVSKDGNELQRRDPYARQSDFESNSCYVINPSFKWDKFQRPKKSELIVYELHVGTFSDDKSSSKFLSVIPRLQHIKNLGFNTVELIPVIEFGGMWGYNPRTLMAPHGKYGTADELRQLVNAAHKVGLAVVFDMVLAHGSTNRNCLWNYDDESSKKGGIYFEGGADSQWGSRFNFGRKEVRDMVEAAALRFVEEYNADGIRIDAAQYLPRELLKNIINAIHKKSEQCFVIAEMTPEDPRVCSELGADSVWIHASYYDMIKLMRNYETDHHMAMLEGIINGHSGFEKNYNAINYVLGSHDQCGNRHPEGRSDDDRVGRYLIDQFGGKDNWHARAQCRMLMALQAVSRPVPMVFMGTELMQSGWWHVDKPVDWKLTCDDASAKGMMALVRDANNLRTSKAGLTQEEGVKFCHHNSAERVIAFARSDVVVVVNCGEGQWEDRQYKVSTPFPSGSKFTQVFNSQDENYGGWSGSWSAPQNERGAIVAEQNGEINITLPKWSVIAFERVSQ